MSRRIAVTGASGMLGQAVSRVLRDRGDQVICLVRAGAVSRCIEGVQTSVVDLSELSSTPLPIGSVDALIHLAQASGWRSFPTGAGKIADVAVGATVRLAEYATLVGAKSFVYASSGGIYGSSADPVTERSPLQPGGELGFYLASKAAGDALVAYFSRYINIQRMRFFFIYGPGQRNDFLFPRLISSVGNGVPIRVAQERGPRINPIFVTDAAQAVVAALDLQESLTVNVAGPEVVSLRDIASMIATHLGRAAVFEFEPGVPSDLVADIALMTEKIGAPVVGLEQGIREMLMAGEKL